MLTTVLEAARIVAVLLSPVTPALSARIYSQLGLAGACAVFAKTLLVCLAHATETEPVDDAASCPELQTTCWPATCGSWDA